MRVGDLVALSARGKKLEACWRWDQSLWRNTPEAAPKTASTKLIGLLIAIENSPWFGRDEQQYFVSWLTEGPYSRDGATHHRHKKGHWHRSDLKFVAKAK